MTICNFRYTNILKWGRGVSSSYCCSELRFRCHELYNNESCQREIGIVRSCVALCESLQHWWWLDSVGYSVLSSSSGGNSFRFNYFKSIVKEIQRRGEISITPFYICSTHTVAKTKEQYLLLLKRVRPIQHLSWVWALSPGTDCYHIW